MTEHQYPRHNAAFRPPARRPPRIEERVNRGINDVDEPWMYGNDAVCDCFPRTSTHTIPSMFYDKLTCPHTHNSHIQPAQEQQFNYPWTANSLSRLKARGDGDDDLSERLSLISEEDPQLRFSPNPIHRNDPDVLSIQTAPPYWYKRDDDARDSKPPYTAPLKDKQILEHGPRAQSMQDIRNPAYRTDGMSPTRGLDSQGENRRQSRLSNRQFTGTYVDPRSGKAYNYNVNYNGTPNPTGTRRPAQDRRKPTTAL